MFDLGSWGEFLIIIIAAVVLVRPDDMPRFLASLGRMIRKFQAYTAQIRHQVDRMTHQVDLEDFQKEVHKSFEDEIEQNLQKIQSSKKASLKPKENDDEK